MTKRRKHRVVVEIAFQEPVLEKAATKLVKRIMGSSYAEIGLYGRHFEVKSFTRVLTACKLKWISKARQQYTGTSIRETLHKMRKG